jgi:hypothetical protein
MTVPRVVDSYKSEWGIRGVMHPAPQAIDVNGPGASAYRHCVIERRYVVRRQDPALLKLFREGMELRSPRPHFISTHSSNSKRA